jgi:uroporphyrinogen decarboxylase
MITPKNRLYRTFMYLETDRVPDVEFGTWPQTVRRWAREGMPAEVAAEIGDSMFHPKFNEFIGVDTEEGGGWAPVFLSMNPVFEHQVLEDDGERQIIRGSDGVTAKWWKAGGDDASIPHYIDFPVKTPADWAAMKDRFRLDDPERTVTAQQIADARQAAADGWSVTGFATGFYGALRNWCGTENLSYLFYDEPEMIRDMLEHWTALILHSLRQLPDDVPVHVFHWWEDMAFNHGPLVSPAMFEEIMVPCYVAVMDELRRHGCTLSSVDCDGNIHDLVPGWMRAGVNIMFPCEVAAKTDMFRLRDEYGLDVRLQGGIDKQAIAQGRDAIDRELDRVAPLLAQGGFIPHLDHLVPPDISLADYMYYREQKQKLIGKK